MDDGWMSGMDRCLDGWMDQSWLGGWVGRWMDGQTDGKRQVLSLSLHVRLLLVYMASLCGWKTEALSR